jgi:hypothetical protein
MAEAHPYRPVHADHVRERLSKVVGRWSDVNQEAVDAATQEEARRSTVAKPADDGTAK